MSQTWMPGQIKVMLREATIFNGTEEVGYSKSLAFINRKGGHTSTGSESINDHSGKLAELTQYARLKTQAIPEVRYSAKQ